MSRFDFAFSVSQVENGGFVATCRDFPHLCVKGKDWDEVLANAEAEMETIFLDHMQAHLDLPAPSAAAIVGECLICVPARTASKARIYDRSRLPLTENSQHLIPRSTAANISLFLELDVRSGISLKYGVL